MSSSGTAKAFFASANALVNRRFRGKGDSGEEQVILYHSDKYYLLGRKTVAGQRLCTMEPYTTQAAEEGFSAQVAVETTGELCSYYPRDPQQPNERTRRDFGRQLPVYLAVIKQGTLLPSTGYYYLQVGPVAVIMFVGPRLRQPLPLVYWAWHGTRVSERALVSQLKLLGSTPLSKLVKPETVYALKDQVGWPCIVVPRGSSKVVPVGLYLSEGYNTGQFKVNLSGPPPRGALFLL